MRRPAASSDASGVDFFDRAADPDDGKRLRNALLRLKELDEQERDPFLD
jgi:hypothetical protein